MFKKRKYPSTIKEQENESELMTSQVPMDESRSERPHSQIVTKTVGRKLNPENEFSVAQ